MENQLDYNSLDFDYEYKQDFVDDLNINSESVEKNMKKDILTENSTESLYVGSVGLKPTREIIRGSVIYEQNGNNNKM